MAAPCLPHRKIARLRSISSWPFDRRNFLVASGIEEFDQAMGHTVLMHKLRHLHIEAAVACDLHDLAFAPPLDGLQALRCLAAAKGRLSNLVQLGAVIDGLVEVGAEIQARYLAWQIQASVSHQNLVVEIDVVVANHQVSTAQLVDEGIDILLSKYPVIASSRALRHPDRHSHVTLLVPTAYIPGGALCFEVKVDEILRHEDAIAASSPGRHSFL